MPAELSFFVAKQQGSVSAVNDEKTGVNAEKDKNTQKRCALKRVLKNVENQERTVDRCGKLSKTIKNGGKVTTSKLYYSDI